MKKILFVIALAVVAAALLGLSTDASANKYRKMNQQTFSTGSSDVASAEINRSMMDCMEFSANFRSRGMGKDKGMFNRQYGSPYNRTGRIMTYSYDNYTSIILDCSKGRCYCKCISK